MPTEIEPNDTRATAQLFTLGSTITGTTSYPYYNDDVYRFEATAAGTLTLTVALPAPQGGPNSIGFRVELQDADGAIVAGRYFSEGTPHYRSFQFGIDEPGTYYLSIPGNSSVQGQYQIATTFQAGFGLFESGNNDTAAQAAAAQFNVPVFGTMATPSDQDWFLYTLPNTGSHIVSIDTQVLSTYAIDYDFTHTLTVAAFDLSGTLLGSKEIQDASPLNVAVNGSAGIRVEVFEGPLRAYDTPVTEQYRLQVSLSGNTGGREQEFNGSAASANAVQFGQAVLGQIASAADQDWFSFQVTTAGTITVTSALAEESRSYVYGYHQLSIRDSAGNLLAADPGPTGQPLSVSVTAPGTYYAVVVDTDYLDYWRDYRLTVDFSPGTGGHEDGLNNDNATADPIGLNATVRGSLSTPVDVDRFVFQVTDPAVVSFNLSATYAVSRDYTRPNMVLEVVDAQGLSFGVTWGPMPRSTSGGWKRAPTMPWCRSCMALPAMTATTGTRSRYSPPPLADWRMAPSPRWHHPIPPLPPPGT